MMYTALCKQLTDRNVRLIAVSKTKPAEQIAALYALGQRDFGENRVQELTEKYEKLPKDIRWHMIGHLQTNKVKYILPFVYMIHSVDRLDLYKTIEREALKAQKKIKILLQFYIAREETKYGLSESEAQELLAYHFAGNNPYIEICGVMGMATFTENETQVRMEFRNLKEIFEALRSDWFSGDDNFSEISMGMSGDYRIAVEEGSTMVRIGSLLFGERNH
jgi:pyridoxal phosphate enzyme (YggS family)